VRILSRTVGPFQANCYLVIDEATGSAVLVDPGDDGAELVHMVQASGARLAEIWLTHAHIDHIGGVAEVQRQLRVPVRLHPLDRPFYDTLSARMAEMYGLPFDQPEPPDLELAEGDELRCGNLRFTVMHVPGHAPGLVSFNGEGVALCGDLLFAGSIGRTDLPLSDPSAMNASLARIATLPEDTVVHPGHGGTTTIGEELKSNPFLSGRARVLSR
jgi:glyoxylase-like metal-dependent hydrolase (beta-lactamase superfamily II)